MNMYVYEVSYTVKNGRTTEHGRTQVVASSPSIAKSDVQRDLDHTYGIGVAKVGSICSKGRA